MRSHSFSCSVLVRNIAVFACSLGLLGGCANMGRSVEPEPFLPPTKAPLDVGALFQVKVDPSTCQSGGAGMTFLKADATIHSDYTRFIAYAYCTQETEHLANEETKKVVFQQHTQRFVELGIAVADGLCREYFDVLEGRRVEARYNQTNMNVAGGVITALLAAAGGHQRAVLNLATGLTAGNAWYENYKSNYVLTPELRKLYDKVRQLQEKTSAEMRAQARPEGPTSATANRYNTYGAAKADLVEYADLCSHKVMVDILNKSLDMARFTTEDVATPSANRDAAEALNAELSGLAGNKDGLLFKAETLEELYVIVTRGGKLDEMIAAINASDTLKPTLGVAVKGLKLDTPTGFAEARVRLVQIGKLLGFGQGIERTRARLQAALDDYLDLQAKQAAADKAKKELVGATAKAEKDKKDLDAQEKQAKTRNPKQEVAADPKVKTAKETKASADKRVVELEAQIKAADDAAARLNAPKSQDEKSNSSAPAPVVAQPKARISFRPVGIRDQSTR